MINGLSMVVHKSLIPALRRQKQTDLCEFKASLVYKTNSRTVRASQTNPVSKRKTEKERRCNKLSQGVGGEIQLRTEILLN